MFTLPWTPSKLVHRVHVICCRSSFRVLDLLEAREEKKKSEKAYCKCVSLTLDSNNTYTIQTDLEIQRDTYRKSILFKFIV